MHVYVGIFRIHEPSFPVHQRDLMERSYIRKPTSKTGKPNGANSLQVLVQDQDRSQVFTILRSQKMQSVNTVVSIEYPHQ